MISWFSVQILLLTVYIWIKEAYYILQTHKVILFVYCYTNNFHVWIHTFSFLQRSRVALKKVSSISKIRTYKDFEIISDETFSHIRWKNNNRIDQLSHNHQLNTKNTHSKCVQFDEGKNRSISNQRNSIGDSRWNITG